MGEFNKHDPRPKTHKARVGQRFGPLTIVEFVGYDHRNRLTYRVRCDCGRETVKPSQQARKCKSRCSVLCKLPLPSRPRVWDKTKAIWYSASTLGMVPAWLDYETFLRDVGPKPGPRFRLARRDITAPHGPGNSRWFGPGEHARAKESHPLYYYWRAWKRSCVPAWSDFEVFVAAVSPRPQPRSCLVRIRDNKPIGPGNWKWVPPISRTPAGRPQYIRELWNRLSRQGNGWQDFAAFEQQVGTQPGPGYRLCRLNRKAPFGPQNYKWRPPGPDKSEGM